MHMPLVYAEGRENAMRRVLREVEERGEKRPQARSKIDIMYAKYITDMEFR